jgi:hypothetical protein
MSIENQLKELERSFPDLRQKMDVRLVQVIGRLAPRFTGDNDRDLALLRGTMEILFKARDHYVLWKSVEDEREYALRVIEHARLYHSEMKRLFR